MDPQRFVTVPPQSVFDEDGRELCVWIEVQIDPSSGAIVNYRMHTTDATDRPVGRLH